jgi:ATP-dependent DNA ligase
LPLEQKFPAILKAVFRLKLPSTVLDGEIVAVDENGIPRFQLLQRFQKQPTAPTLYFVFDVLWSNGTDITGKTLNGTSSGAGNHHQISGRHSAWELCRG